MKHPEQTPKNRAAETGLFATLSNLLRGQGSSAPSTSLGTPSPQITKAEQAHLPAGVGPRRRASLGFASVLALAAFISLGATSALAAPPTHFGTEGSGPGQFIEPRGIAIDQQSGAVYVADGGNNRIDKFDSEGKFLLSFGWGVADGSTEALQTCTTICFSGLQGPGVGQFNGDEGIAVDNGDLYVLELANHRIQKFDPEGHFILMFGGQVNRTKVEAAAPAAEQNVCPIDPGDGCQAGVAGTGPGEFTSLFSHSLAVDSAGTVYVGDAFNGSEKRVQKFSPEAVPVGTILLPGAGGFFENLAVDSAGDLYVQTGASAGVHKYDATGAELGTPRDEAGALQALAIGPADQLFLNDLRGCCGEEIHHLLGFDAAGELLASFDRGSEAEDGHRGIAYSEVTEALYVLNERSVRVVTPPSPGPFVLPGSEAATEVRPTAATLGAQVNPEGGAETKCRFQYVDAESFTKEGGFASPNTEQTTPTELTGGEFEDQPVSAPISPLQPRTTYHFRVLCENAAAETSTGPDQEFTTLPPVSIDATFATAVTATSATLGAELNPHGLPSTYRFEYDTSPYLEGEPGHGTRVPVPDGSLGSGVADVLRTAQIQGLVPLTAYHYRVVAENSLGTVEGPDRSFITQGAAASLLPDGRLWEMVSPPNKHGSPIEPITEEGGDIQAAADGSGLAYVALGPLGSQSQGVRSPTDNQWLSNRTEAGWTTQDVTTPYDQVNPLNAGDISEYKQFSEDLSASVVEPLGSAPLSPQATERTPYRREKSGEFVPLATPTNVPPGTKIANNVRFLTASPDLSHVILGSAQILASGFEPGFEPNGASNLYEFSAGNLRLVSILPNQEPASEAGLSGGVGNQDLNMRGAISADGNRVFFQAGEHLYVRDLALGKTLRIDEVQGGPGPAGALTNGIGFQAASADGSKIFFTDASRLTTDATSEPFKPDLYVCAITVSGGQLSCALSDLSVDPNPGESANVQGEVGAIDVAGDHVFFAANGVLTTTANAEGEHAVPGLCNSEGESTCNLYEYDTVAHQISLVAVLSSEDSPDWAGHGNLAGLGNLTARSSPDGRYFSFMSRRGLTGYDNRDAASGQPDEEVFIYDAETGALRCASCNPTGARPHGVFDKEGFPGLLVDHPSSWGGNNATPRWLAASIPGYTLALTHFQATYQSRYLSKSGRLFFTAADALVPQDTNGVMDVYEYEPPGVGDCTTASPTYGAQSGGCVSLISSGTSPEESAFLDASESGDDVFFLTASRLAPTDVDNAFDVYDAAVGGSTHEAVAPVECSGDACQQPATPPNDATPGSLTFNGAGNLLQCPKGKVKKSGKCVAKHKAKKHKKKGKKHAKKHAKKRPAGHNGGGGK